MKVLSIDPVSPLFGYVRPGYALKSVNGREVLDNIDFNFRVSDEQVRLTFADIRGKEVEFDFDSISAGELGLTFDDHKIRFCKNDCIFCFVAQQPQGMRRTLYFRDEDYRLSFTHGNFVTLSNTTEADLKRIIEQRLSPMYVSVHATDDKLRRCMLRNEKLAPILPRLKHLTENGITIHSQVVLCPGINDGGALEKTVNDLAGLYPGVKSLAVVPVGLTRHRKGMAKLKQYEPGEASELIEYVERQQDKFLGMVGSRFVWPADEFYVIAGRPFPRLFEYEDMPQFENGIGMVREFVTMFNRRRSRLKSIKSKLRVMMITGHSAYRFLKTEILPYVDDNLSLNLSFHPVVILVLPPNCLNSDDLFLDNLTLSQFKQTLGKPVVVGRYNLTETVTEVFS